MCKAFLRVSYPFCSGLFKGFLSFLKAFLKGIPILFEGVLTGKGWNKKEVCGLVEMKRPVKAGVILR